MPRYSKKRLSLLPYRISYLALVFVVLVTLQHTVLRQPGSKANDVRSSELPSNSKIPMRRLLYLTQVTSNETVRRGDNATNAPDTTDGTLGNTEVDLCTVPAYHEFPPDLFGQKLRAQGALVVHFLVVIYMFVALAIVCDVYFVASLEKISEKLHLSDDVAGATFMAAGSSAPELFTSIIGVFIAKGDVGVGTIVGSAVFNILFVIGVCGLLVNQAVSLARFPLVRDIFFYTISVAILILSIMDSQVTWYESLTMLLFYVLYIIVMIFNPKIYQWATFRIRFFSAGDDSACSILHQDDDKTYYQSYEMFDNEIEGIKASPNEEANIVATDEYMMRRSRKLSFEDACFCFMKSKRFSPTVRFRSAAYLIISERRKWLHERHTMTSSSSTGLATNVGGYQDGSEHKFDKWYMVTFSLTIVWIAIFSYIMVWMVALIGFTLRIPDSIMGITFLAAGTSVPDAMASVMVARQGHGDMAVSNTMGSNVFDVLICLALPWFIMTTCVEPGSSVHINSNGMVFSVLLLFLTVIITICSVHFGGWKLDKKLGAICLSSYALFLLFSCLIEFNVFGFVNLPMCTE